MVFTKNMRVRVKPKAWLIKSKSNIHFADQMRCLCGDIIVLESDLREEEGYRGYRSKSWSWDPEWLMPLEMENE